MVITLNFQEVLCILLLTGKVTGDHYNKYENKRKHFPPPNERDGETVQISNNKYNLGNPLK